MLALVRLSILSIGVLPMSLLAADIEMGRDFPPAIRERGDKEALLAQFKAEYEAVQEEPRPVFQKYLPLLGSDALLSFLEETYPACHAQAHDLGKALFAEHRDLGAALQACGTRCTSGCMHGVVAEAFKSATLDALIRQMNTFCKEGDMAQLHKPGNCAHALGHALMFVNNGDVRKSVDACLGFTSEAMQYYCATGVYMEKLVTGPQPETPLPSLYAPCDQELLFPSACYRYKAPDLLDSLGTPTRLLQVCLQLEEPQRRGCFHGLGYAMKEKVFTDPKQLSLWCKRGARDDQIMCIEGAIEKLADYDEERAKNACSFFSDPLRLVCLRAATDKMYSLTKSTLALYYNRDRVTKRKEERSNDSGIPHRK